ncbi:MAG: 50S ribosomal protein L17 [Lentimicrobiaceae bacterium]|nr:50S ribosomal protein L17 [Lentimicrobiaceae bacterium]
MRHAKKNNHLGRTAAHREAMLSNMAASLLLHKRISTTLAKAKELRKYIEPLITRSKEDTTHSRRVVFSYLQNKFAVSELFREISQKVGNRPGGYTRILKTGFRKGDNAEMCIIELVDYNETYTLSDDTKKTPKTRRSRSKAKAEPQEKAPKAVVTETAKVVAPEPEVKETVAVVAEPEATEVVENVVEEVVEEVVLEPEATEPPVEEEVKE